MMLNRPFVLALVLGALTALLIGLLVNYLPPDGAKDAITSALTIPGAFIAGVIYPEGPHTGYGAPNWGSLVMAANLLCYVLFWFVCLRIAQRIRRRRL